MGGFHSKALNIFHLSTVVEEISGNDLEIRSLRKAVGEIHRGSLGIPSFPNVVEEVQGEVLDTLRLTNVVEENQGDILDILPLHYAEGKVQTDNPAPEVTALLDHALVVDHSMNRDIRTPVGSVLETIENSALRALRLINPALAASESMPRSDRTLVQGMR